jgi:hypothetical protein
MGIPTRKELDAKKQEINVLYGKVSEIESSLKEEKKINARLRGDLAAKVHQLTGIEKSIVEEQEHYRWTKSDDTNKMDVTSSEGRKRIEELDLLDGDMAVEMAEHDLMEEENERLHARLKRVAIEHFQASVAQKEEREMRKQGSFEMRATMEQILRRTLKEVDREYMLKANDKMDSEADWARIENAKLKKEAIKRQENCASLVRQQQESYEELVHVKVQKDVLHESAIKQEESSQLAEVSLAEIRGTNDRLEEHITELEADIETLISQLDHKKKLQKELLLHQKKLSKAEEERRRVQRLIVVTCRKSVERGLSIAAQMRKREGRRLTKGFKNIGGATEESKANNETAKDNGGEVDESTVVTLESNNTGSVAPTSMTFLNNEDTVLAMEREEEERKSHIDAEAAWNSTKSDVHVATKLRLEIRKIRKRELRENLRVEAAHKLNAK